MVLVGFGGSYPSRSCGTRANFTRATTPQQSVPFDEGTDPNRNVVCSSSTHDFRLANPAGKVSHPPCAAPSHRSQNLFQTTKDRGPKVLSWPGSQGHRVCHRLPMDYRVVGSAGCLASAENETMRG